MKWRLFLLSVLFVSRVAAAPRSVVVAPFDSDKRAFRDLRRKLEDAVK